MKVPWPARVSLARLPTPLERSPRLGARHGLDLWWKRDDLTGLELSGNKVRKLEFLLADAQAQGADTVITCGGVQSNHCRATAAAAAKLGLSAVVLLRVPDPAAPPPLAANSLLVRLAGAEIRYVSPQEYQDRQRLFAEIAGELARRGRRAYAFPEGGSNEVGAWGYIAAIAELREQATAAGIDGPITIACAAGSAGTGAGIELGLRLAGWRQARALGFAVCDDAAYFKNEIARIASACIERYALDAARLTPDEIAIDDGSIGPGYAQTAPDLLGPLMEAARDDGVFLDPVYTGKALHGLLRLRRDAPERLPGPVIFIHTGGLFGAFPFAAELAALAQ